MPPPSLDFAAPILQPPTQKLPPTPEKLPPRGGKNPKILYQAYFAKTPSKTSVEKWGVAAKKKPMARGLCSGLLLLLYAALVLFITIHFKIEKAFC